MSYSIAELRAASDAELIREHDEVARNTSFGVSFYIEELDRRSRDRSTDAALKLARRGFWIGALGLGMAVAALVVAVITLLTH